MMPKTAQTTKVTDTAIGREYIRQHSSDTIFTRGYWHRYSLGVWEPVPDADIEVEIWELLEDFEKRKAVRPSMSNYRTVLNYAKSHLFTAEDRLDSFPNLINLKNGIYNLDTDKLTSHNPALLLTSQLPFEYDEKAVSPWWNHYVKTTFISNDTGQYDESLARLAQEAVAYSLTTDVSYQVMFWCLGEGENGKGVLFHILSQLGGNTATPLDLNSLQRERYQLATLADKRIALCSESSSTKNLLEDATIKALVAGDEMQVRQIRREPFILKPQVKLWWSMNRLPVVADTSHGMWRRIVMLPFNKIFDEKIRIRDLKVRLDGELPGVFNWSLDGHKRLRAEGKFSYCDQSNGIKDRDR
jgi:putative DNA primase/helicase